MLHNFWFVNIAEFAFFVNFAILNNHFGIASMMNVSVETVTIL